MSEFKHCATCMHRNKDTNEANITSFTETSYCNTCVTFTDSRLPSHWERDPEVITIADSGDRREFPSGAVRDMAEGKGRCDLMPLDVVAEMGGTIATPDDVLLYIDAFMLSGDISNLYMAIECFRIILDVDSSTMLLELAQHFEQGAKKYKENNWKEGIPARSYIDSAVRHYLKFLRGDTDERHDRAFVWNLVCCIWTCIHKPELNDYRKGETEK